MLESLSSESGPHTSVTIVLQVYIDTVGSYFCHALAPLNATVVIHLPQAWMTIKMT